MRKLTLKQQFEEIINELPESKLKAVIDFAGYPRDKEESESLLRIQMSSNTYKEWLNPENDIYDEIFKNELD